MISIAGFLERHPGISFFWFNRLQDCRSAAVYLKWAADNASNLPGGRRPFQEIPSGKFQGIFPLPYEPLQQSI